MLLITILSATAALTIRPSNIKSWLGKSDIYKLLPDAFLNQAKEDTDNNIGVPLTDPGVQKAAKDAFSPQFLQTSTESIIDGTFRWLDGSKPKPDFSIDVGTAKDKFANNVADYAKVRYAGLAACTPGVIPTSTNPLTIECQPAVGINIDQEAEKIKSQIQSTDGFLSEPNLTADTLEQDKSNDSSFNKTETPNGYQWARRIPIVLVILIIINVAIILFTSVTKRAGVKRIAILMIVTGTLTATIMGLGSLTSGAINKSAGNATGDWSAIVKNLASTSLPVMQRDILKVGLLISGAVIVTGIILLIVLRLTNKEEQGNTQQPSLSPKKAPNPKPQLAQSAPQQTEPTTAPLIQQRPSNTKPKVGSRNKLIQ